jgi:hypothetical protein
VRSRTTKPLPATPAALRRQEKTDSRDVLQKILFMNKILLRKIYDRVLLAPNRFKYALLSRQMLSF